LREIYVGLGAAGELVDLEGPLSTPALDAYFERLGVWPVEGQRSEVNLAAIDWLRAVALGLERGFVLTIDYGDSAERLYSPLRPEGTLMAYTGGKVTDDPYSNPGQTDITAHVDFTALMAYGEEAGLQTIWQKRQMEFLIELGLGDMIAALMAGSAPATQAAYAEVMERRLRLFRLIDPDGLGRFHVLLQQKGVT
jgi:SAM-dependent MidA family methyltransferase